MLAGYSFGCSFDAVDPTGTYHGEVISYLRELWHGPTIFRPNTRRSHAVTRYPGEAGEREPASRDLQDQRERSLPLLLKATVMA